MIVNYAHMKDLEMLEPYNESTEFMLGYVEQSGERNSMHKDNEV